MPEPILANVFENPFALVILLLVALLFFGHKLPQVARSLGSSVSEFKKGVKAGEEQANQEAEDAKKAAVEESSKK